MQILYVQIVLRMALSELSLRLNSVHIPLHTSRPRAKWDSSGAWKDRHDVCLAFL